MTFSDFSLAQELQASVRLTGFDQPTPIQREAIPPALEGRDILASAETGSGKTAAFLLPIMNRLLTMQRGATRALVIAPTRELAAQIVEHFRLLARGTRLSCAAVHGGVAMGAAGTLRFEKAWTCSLPARAGSLTTCATATPTCPS